MSRSTVVDKPTIFDRETFKYNSEKDFLGAGEFGEVFTAELLSTGDAVAVKVLNTPQRLKQIELDALMKEAVILQRLRGHINVVQLKGICINPRHYALVLEYVDNGNLEDLLLTKREVQPIVKQWNCRSNMGLDVARGMLYLHTQSYPITHRDLKSSNVLVTKNYRCKISDFGLAKMRGISSQTTRRSHRGRQDPAGTLSFIAPERFTGEADPDKGQKIDVYSFGVVLWQLKEMAKPYASEVSASTIRENVVAGLRPKISEDSSCPVAFKDLIPVCWSANPDDRPEFTVIVRELITVVTTLESDSCLSRNSKPIDTEHPVHSFASSGAPVAAPVDTSMRSTDSLLPFRSAFASRPQRDASTSSSSDFQRNGTPWYRHEPMETSDVSSMSNEISAPPTMSGLNQQTPDLSRSAMPLVTGSTVGQSGRLQYTASGATHGSTQGFHDLPSQIVSAGQLVSSPDNGSAHSGASIFGRNQDVMRDALPGGAANVAPQTTPNIPDHFWALKFNWQVMLENLVVDYVIDRMFSQISMFSMDDMDKITSPRTRLEKAKQLLYWLINHSYTEYWVFLDSLKESQRHLYDVLIRPVPDSYKTSQFVGSDSYVVYQPPHTSQLLHQELAAGAARSQQPVRPPSVPGPQLIRPPSMSTGQPHVQQFVAPAGAQQMQPPYYSGWQQSAIPSSTGTESGGQGVYGGSGYSGPVRQAAPVTRRRSIEECIRALGQVEELNEFNSGQLFMRLSENLGHEWRSFARYLGSTTAAIENIEADHSSQKERGYQVLLQWTRRGTASRTALYNAIMSVDPSGALIERLITGQQ